MSSIQNLKDDCRKNQLYSCGFIGCGNMAKAIVSGLVQAKLFEGSDILISGTREASFERWKDLKVHTTLDNEDLIKKCRIIFLCVKPHMMSSVALSMGFLREAKYPCTHQTLVSVLAGVSTESIKSSFSFLTGINIIRAMPNTPLMVGDFGCLDHTAQIFSISFPGLCWRNCTDPKRSCQLSCR